MFAILKLIMCMAYHLLNYLSCVCRGSFGNKTLRYHVTPLNHEGVSGYLCASFQSIYFVVLVLVE